MTLARAEEKKSDEIETEHLFSFNRGTDVDNVGSKEIEAGLDGRFEKRTGTYTVLSPSLGYEFVPVENLRLELEATSAFFDISNVSGLEDRKRGAFESVSLEIRYRLLDREKAPIGLTVMAEPKFGRADETSGAPVDLYGIEFGVFADKELIPKRLVGVVNLRYEPEAVRSRPADEWERESTLTASTGLMYRLKPDTFLGAELRYLRKYEAAALDNFAGHALFIGPAAYTKLADHWWMSAGASFQVAGRAVDDPRALDLTNFERFETKLRLGYEF